MAAASGGVRLRLEPEDEYTHPLETAEICSESMSFNICDPIVDGVPAGRTSGA